MTDAQPGRPAGEPTVSDQEYVLAESAPLIAPVIMSISRMPGPPLGPS